MTTKDYLKKLKSAQGVLAESEGANFTDSMMEITEIWSNDSCIGYFLRAAQIAGVDRILLGKSWMPIVWLLKRSPLMKRRSSIANIKHNLKTRLGEYK